MPKKNELAGLITGLVSVIAAACFFILGFLTHDWHYAWLIFLAVPVTAVIANIVTKNKDISGSIIALVAILCAAAFFILGFLFDIWHPGWLVFLAIPIAAMIFEIAKKKDVSGSIIGIVSVSAVAAFILAGTFLIGWHLAWLILLVIPIVAIIMNIVKITSGSHAAEAEAREEQENQQ